MDNLNPKTIQNMDNLAPNNLVSQKFDSLLTSLWLQWRKNIIIMIHCCNLAQNWIKLSFGPQGPWTKTIAHTHSNCWPKYSSTIMF